MVDIRGPGLLYLAQQKKHMGRFVCNTKRQIFKAGRTHDPVISLKDYPDGTVYCNVSPVNSMLYAEKALLEICRKRFRSRLDVGLEYFECEYFEIKDAFIAVRDIFPIDMALVHSHNALEKISYINTPSVEQQLADKEWVINLSKPIFNQYARKSISNKKFANNCGAGFIFVAQLKEHLGKFVDETERQIFKQGIVSEWKEYPLGTIFFHIAWVENVNDAHISFMGACKNRFRRRLDFGDDFYECDHSHIKCEFERIEIHYQIDTSFVNMQNQTEEISYENTQSIQQQLHSMDWLVHLRYRNSASVNTNQINVLGAPFPMIENIDQDELSKLMVNEAFYNQHHLSSSAQAEQPLNIELVNDMTTGPESEVGIRINQQNISRVAPPVTTEDDSDGALATTIGDFTSQESWIGMFLALDPSKINLDVRFVPGKCTLVKFMKTCFSEFFHTHLFPDEDTEDGLAIFSKLGLTIEMERFCKACNNIAKCEAGKCAHCHVNFRKNVHLCLLIMETRTE